MGLDISVYKLKKVSKKDIEDLEYFKLIDNDGNEDFSKFPEWSYNLIVKITEEWFDWDKLKEQDGFDLAEWNWCSTNYDEEISIEFENKFTKERRILNSKDIPVYNKELSVIGYTEIGYQRKGLNSQFYQDYEASKIGYFVWNKEDLYKYKELYCTTSEDKEHFQKNIIDNFIEGECCVAFDW